MTVCAQTATPRDERTLEDRRLEAEERIRQWHADAMAATAGGNELWAAECAARALVWIETLNALDAGVMPRPRAARRSNHV